MTSAARPFHVSLKGSITEIRPQHNTAHQTAASQGRTRACLVRLLRLAPHDPADEHACCVAAATQAHSADGPTSADGVLQPATASRPVQGHATRRDAMQCNTSVHAHTHCARMRTLRMACCSPPSRYQAAAQVRHRPGCCTGKDHSRQCGRRACPTEGEGCWERGGVGWGGVGHQRGAAAERHPICRPGATCEAARLRCALCVARVAAA